MRVYAALALFEGCPFGWLDSGAQIREALEAAVAAGPFTLLQLVVQPFTPHGVTACAIVGESHLSVHTWPEEGRLFLDVASCSTQESVRRAVSAFAACVPGGRLSALDERIIEPGGARASEPR
jgi:S-adenosylmethionine decarboxylase